MLLEAIVGTLIIVLPCAVILLAASGKDKVPEVSPCDNYIAGCADYWSAYYGDEYTVELDINEDGDEVTAYVYYEDKGIGYGQGRYPADAVKAAMLDLPTYFRPEGLQA